MFLRGLAKLLPLIVHELVDIALEKLKERKQRRESEQLRKELEEAAQRKENEDTRV